MSLRLPALLAVSLAGLAIAWLAVPLGVLAHADYDRSEPALDEVLPEPPERIDVWFTQELFKREGANFVRVFDEQDVQVSEGDGVVDDDDRTHMYANITGDLAPGRYIVRWMTLSDEDGDQDEGEFCFYVGVEPTEEQAAECAEISAQEPTLTPVSTEPSDVEAPTDGGPTEAPGDAEEDDDDGNASTAVIVGVLVAVVVAVLAAGAFVVWMRRPRA